MCKLNPALKEKATVLTPKTIAEDVHNVSKSFEEYNDKLHKKNASKTFW